MAAIEAVGTKVKNTIKARMEIYHKHADQIRDKLLDIQNKATTLSVQAHQATVAAVGSQIIERFSKLEMEISETLDACPEGFIVPRLELNRTGESMVPF